jgi:heterodisulfide reductase subunit B
MTTAKGSSDALFLGCIAPLRFPDIEAATRHVFETLNGGLVDIEGMGCCPTKASFTNIDEITALAISGRNIALAEEKGANLVTICNGCFSILAEAKHDLDNDPGKRAEVNEVLGGIDRRYRGSSKVFHFVEYLHDDVGVSKVASSVTNSLRGMRLAVFHGCHYLRPSDVLGTDDPEDPKKIRDLVSAIGGRSVPYIGQLECCGAGGGVRARDLDTSLVHLEERLEGIQRAEVDAIVTVCPFCFLQFDIGQGLINEKKGTDYAIPVFHLSQLIALAQGADAGKVAKMSKTPRHKTIQAIQEGGS